MHQRTPLLFVCLMAIIGSPSICGQEQEEKDEAIREVELAEGRLTVQVSESWKQVEPRFNMIDAEFSIEKVGEDEKNGRMTVMGAGGSIQQNIDRWIGQFSQSDGSPSADAAKQEKKEINGMQVHFLDISGTYADSAGPRAPATHRPNYRMLAAIIETDGSGNYFVKLYGGENTIGENAERFKKMIKSVKKKE